MLDISLFGTLFFAVDMNGVYGNFQTGKQVLVWSLRFEVGIRNSNKHRPSLRVVTLVA